LKKLVLIIATMALPVFANAQQWGAFGGLNMSTFDADGVSYDAEMGFEVGAQAIWDIGMPVKLRTGAGYVQKNSSFDVLGSTVEISLSYIEVPVTALYSFSEAAGIFGGLNLDINVGDDCEVDGGSCTVNDVESLIYGLVVGGRFNITGPSFIEAYYEMGLAEVAPDTDHKSSLGVRYAHMF
jgi:Outer membrane protein beta-barrel domain